MVSRMARANHFLSQVMTRLRAEAPIVSADLRYHVRLDRAGGGTFAQVWFLTRGCTWDRAGACTMCNYGRGPTVSDDDMVASVRDALASIAEPVEELFVSPSGSMLDPSEVSHDARRRIFDVMAGFPSPKVCIETRSETVTQRSIRDIEHAFAGRSVTVELGLESSSAFVQRYCINRMSEPRVFQEAATQLRAAGIRVSANVALGSAFLNPRESIDDATASISWALTHGANLVVLFPMHVKPHTLLAWLQQRKLYEPPSLWSLIETLSRVRGEDLSRVTISWYRSNYVSGGPNRIAPTTCPQCLDTVLAALDRFRNEPGPASVAGLQSLTCTCRDEWARTVATAPTSSTLPERTLQQYDLLANELGLSDWWRLHELGVTEAMRSDVGGNSPIQTMAAPHAEGKDPA
jgi:archaeosine synthase beta-subunit